MHDAVIIEHVSASEIEEKPVAEPIDTKELKARAESVLKYCMGTDAARLEKKEREAREAKANKVIQEMVDYLERKCIAAMKFYPACSIAT